MSTASANDIVMTLDEAATFLRVSKEAVVKAITEQGLEAVKSVGSGDFCVLPWRIGCGTGVQRHGCCPSLDR
jgi:excisionase family DNA binding protein